VRAAFGKLGRAGLVIAAGGAALGLAACTTTTASRTTSTTGATTTTTARTTTTNPATTTTAGTTGTCQPAQLQMTPQTGSGAAGTIQESILMTNISSTTCTMDGYPGMQLLDGNGNSLPTNVVRGGTTFGAAAANQPPALVTLAPQKSAAFSLSYSDVPEGTATSCPTSAKSEITPPNDTAFAVITIAITACGQGTIHVSPVYPTP
jgi:Protein of unknown function (DUF4232)